MVRRSCHTLLKNCHQSQVHRRRHPRWSKIPDQQEKWPDLRLLVGKVGSLVQHYKSVYGASHQKVTVKLCQSSKMKMHTLFLFKIDQNWRQWPNEPCMLQYSTYKRQTYVSFQESSNFLAFVRCNFLKIAIFRSLKCRFALLLDTFWIIIRTFGGKGYPLMPIWSLSDGIFMGN